MPAGSRRTSARLPRDHRVPCKIFGLEDGQSGAEPRVESEVDARAQQVLHYVRIRCYTPPHSLIQSNGQPPLSPCAASLLPLVLSLSLSLPWLTTLCRSRERASTHDGKREAKPYATTTTERSPGGEMRTSGERTKEKDGECRGEWQQRQRRAPVPPPPPLRAPTSPVNIKLHWVRDP